MISQTLLEPTNFFEILKEQPRPFYPIVLVLLNGLLLTVATFPFVQQEINQIFELNPSISNTIIMFSIMTLLLCGGFVIELIIHSLIVYFIVALFSTEVQNFRTVLSIIGYSWVPIMIKFTFFIFLVLVTKEIFEPQGLLVLFPGVEDGIFALILKNIDVFIIWQYVLVYLGVKCLLKHQYWVLSASIALFTFIISLTFKSLPSVLTMLM